MMRNSDIHSTYYQKWGFLNLAFSKEALTFDPRQAFDKSSQFVARMLYDGLTRLDAHGRLELAVAESVEISRNKKTYTFHLRPCTWSNGAEVTADDFELTWKEALSSRHPQGVAWDFIPILNVYRVLKGEASIDEVGIQALDSKTLVVELERPTPKFLEMTSAPSYFPVYLDADKMHPEWGECPSPIFISNGPFYLQSWRKGCEVFLEKNPLYWDHDNISLPGIHISFIEDMREQFALFQQGKIDWMGSPFINFNSELITSLNQPECLEVYAEDVLKGFWLNTRSFPLSSKLIRQAFDSVLDPHKLINNRFFNIQKPISGGLINKATSLGNYRRSQEEASHLFERGLQELKITRACLKPLSIVLSKQEGEQGLAHSVGRILTESFGIQVNVESVDDKDYSARLKKGDFEIAEFAVHPKHEDPLFNIQILQSSHEVRDVTGWVYPGFQNLIEETMFITHEQNRATKRCEVERILREEVPFITIFSQSFCFIKKQNILDIVISKKNDVDFRWASFVSECEGMLNKELLLKP